MTRQNVALIPMQVSQLRGKDKNITSIYVVNNTGNLGTKDKPSIAGEVIIPIVDGTDSVPVKVPNTWIPIDISAQADVEDIIKSSRFLRAVNSRAIILIDEAQALKILENADAHAELDRLAVDRGASRPSEITSTTTQIEKNVYPPLVRIMSNEVYREQERMAAIRNMLPKLGVDDWRYVIVKCKPEETELKKFALDQQTK